MHHIFIKKVWCFFMRKLKKALLRGSIYAVTFLSLFLYGIVEQNAYSSENDVQTENEDGSFDSLHEIEKKQIAITFDDGPCEKWTTYLLDELKKRDVVATFFVVGKNAARNKELIYRMKKEGHMIGNHTYSHIEITSCSDNVVKEEIERTNSLIKEITQEDTIFLRPCYGKYDKKHSVEDDMMVVMWDIDPYDWRTTDVNKIVDNVLKNVAENKIILMHDIYESSVKAAVKIVDELTKRGYRFVTVDEILGL